MNTNKPAREYYRNHRTIGYKIGVTIIDGSEYTLLQTESLDPIACLTIRLLPIDAKERLFDARLAIADAIERARFLGIEDAGIENLMKEELHREPEKIH